MAWDTALTAVCWNLQDSKLANLMFALELHRRCAAAGLPIVSNALHPGVVPSSEFFRDQSCCMRCFLRCCCCARCFLQTLDEASDGEVCVACPAAVVRPAASSVTPLRMHRFAGTHPSLHGKGGMYLDYNGRPTMAARRALDTSVHQRLWAVTAAATDVSPEICDQVSTELREAGVLSTHAGTSDPDASAGAGAGAGAAGSDADDTAGGATADVDALSEAGVNADAAGSDAGVGADGGAVGADASASASADAGAGATDDAGASTDAHVSTA